MKTISGLPTFCLSLGVPCEHHLHGFVFGDSGSRLNLCFLWCLAQQHLLVAEQKFDLSQGM